MGKEHVFLMHLYCANCLRQSVKTVVVPRVEGAPSTVGEFIEALEARPVPFQCRHCESLIGTLIGVTMERDDETDGEDDYMVVPFLQRGKKIVPDQPRAARNEEHAKAMAERLAETRPGVLAFSRSGDPDLGEFDDAVVLARYGQVPEEMLA